MFLPTALLALATLLAGIVAYGTHPNWGALSWGYEFILFSRRFQWVMAAGAIVLCVAVLGLVVSGKRRAWWLIGLGPVLALFFYRFYNDAREGFVVAEDPAFVSADEGMVEDGEHVVGLEFKGQYYAYPYSRLYYSPVVVQTDHDRKLVLMWSPFANRALAFEAERQLRARELEIVSMPANALLVYNKQLGEFINGVSGQTPSGGRPTGFGARVATTKATWKNWREMHSGTKVLAPRGEARGLAGVLRPYFAQPGIDWSKREETRVTLLATTRPVVVSSKAIGERPLNLVTEDGPVVMFRDRRGLVRAFERRVEDLTPKFRLNGDARRAGVFMIDSDTGSGWGVDGRAVDGPAVKEKRKLRGMEVDDFLPWEVVKQWMPGVKLVSDEEVGKTIVVETQAPATRSGRPPANAGGTRANRGTRRGR